MASREYEHMRDGMATIHIRSNTAEIYTRSCLVENLLPFR
jgi:hypothetical protein